MPDLLASITTITALLIFTRFVKPHLIVNLDSIRPSCSDNILAEYLQAKKKIWNDLHDITIYGYEVELYAQDAAEQHIATGVFSIEKNEWLLKPEHIEPAIDDVSIKSKSAELMNWIDEIPTGQCSSLPEIERIKEKIRRMRRSGLQEAGEFSVENLVFKTLRNNGYLEKLSDLQNSITDTCLSIDNK